MDLWISRETACLAKTCVAARAEWWMEAGRRNKKNKSARETSKRKEQEKRAREGKQAVLGDGRERLIVVLTASHWFAPARKVELFVMRGQAHQVV